MPPVLARAGAKLRELGHLRPPFAPETEMEDGEDRAEDHQRGACNHAYRDKDGCVSHGSAFFG